MSTKSTTTAECISSIDRESEQLQRGVWAWIQQARAELTHLENDPGAREDQLDHRRKAQSLRRTLDALDRLERKPRVASDQCGAALIHRREWIRERLSDGLTRAGVEIIGSVDDGSAGLALALVEQPDLIVLEDRLPWMRAVDLVRTVHEFAPDTLVVVQAETVESGEECVEAGASLALGRTTSPDEVCSACLTLLQFEDPAES